MKTSETIKTIAGAIVKAQSEAKGAIKDGMNTFFNNAKYATLDSVIEATRKPLSDNKLAVIQAPIDSEGNKYVLTRIQHECGEYYEIMTPLLFSKQDMQAYGSAITYAKRYALASMLNISTDGDDDGNKTQGDDKDKEKPKENGKYKKDPFYFTEGTYAKMKFDEVLPEDFDSYLTKLESVVVKNKAVLDLISNMKQFKQQKGGK